MAPKCGRIWDTKSRCIGSALLEFGEPHTAFANAADLSMQFGRQGDLAGLQL